MIASEENSIVLFLVPGTWLLKMFICLLPLLKSNKEMLLEVGGLSFWRLVLFAGQGGQVNWARSTPPPPLPLWQVPTFNWLGGVAVSLVWVLMELMRETVLEGRKLLISLYYTYIPVTVSVGLFFFFGLHCMACGILVPKPGIKPMPPALEAWSFKLLDHQGSPLVGFCWN